MAIGRLSVLKSGLLLNESTDTYDDEFKLLLGSSTKQVERYTNRRLESSSITDEYYSGSGYAVPKDNRNLLYLNEYPVTALSAVSIYDSGTETYVAESTDYMQLLYDERNVGYGIYYPKLGQESNAKYGTWPKGQHNIKITYTAGYVTTNWDSAAITASFDVPADLEYATCMLAATRWLEGRESEGRIGKSGIEIADQNFMIERYQHGISPEVETILKRYKRISY